MKQIHLYLIVVFISLISSCSGKDNKPTPSTDEINSVKTELNAFRKYLPIEGGVGLMITNVDFDDASNAIKYKYQYTLPGAHKPTEDQIKQAKKTAVAIIQSQPKEKKLIEQGFIFRYDYYSNDNEYLWTMEMSLKDLQAE